MGDLSTYSDSKIVNDSKNFVYEKMFSYTKKICASLSSGDHNYFNFSADFKDIDLKNLIQKYTSKKDNFSLDCIIYDATFSKQRWRDDARSIANELGVDFKFINVICSDEDEIKRRLSIRSECSKNTAGYEIRLGQKDHYENLSINEIDLVVNTISYGDSCNIISNYLRRDGLIK